MVKRYAAGIVLAVMITSLTGCGSGEEAAPKPEGRFDPCTVIPADKLRAAGVDPGTAKQIFPTDQRDCEWKGDAYSLRVDTISQAITEYEQKNRQETYEDTVIAGRSGRLSRSGSSICSVLLPTDAGTIIAFQAIVSSFSPREPEDPCAVLRRTGEIIIPVLPK